MLSSEGFDRGDRKDSKAMQHRLIFVFDACFHDCLLTFLGEYKAKSTREHARE